MMHFDVRGVHRYKINYLKKIFSKNILLNFVLHNVTRLMYFVKKIQSYYVHGVKKIMCFKHFFLTFYYYDNFVL